MEDLIRKADIPGFPGYSIRSDGKVFFWDGKEKIVSLKKGRSAKVIIRRNYKMYTLGLATLLADAFIPNPFNYKRILFKDRNHHNCNIKNIAWVDDETYFYYCCHGILKRGRPKCFGVRNESIKSCTDPNIRKYYITLNENWLLEAWNEIDKNLSEFGYWKKVKGEVYLHFLDRVRRFSIIGKGTGLMYFYARAEYLKLKKTISPNLPFKRLLQTDESLRIINKR